MMYIRSETNKQMIMAQSLQLRFRASFSKLLALFLMENAVSLILELLDTISYSYVSIKKNDIIKIKILSILTVKSF